MYSTALSAIMLEPGLPVKEKKPDARTISATLGCVASVESSASSSIFTSVGLCAQPRHWHEGARAKGGGGEEDVAHMCSATLDGTHHVESEGLELGYAISVARASGKLPVGERDARILHGLECDDAAPRLESCL